MTDKICVSARLFRICAMDVEFNALIAGNKQIPGFLDIFGIGPLSVTESPKLVSALVAQGLIDNEIAVINLNVTRNWRSSLTLGGIPP